MNVPKGELRIVGTSHIARASVQEIKRVFSAFQPDILAIELDKRRLQSLQQTTQRSVSPALIRHVGVTGYIFLVLGSFLQRKLGNIVKIQPGADMLTAVQLAKEHKKQLFLVDQDVMITMRRLSKAFTWHEKFRVVWDIVTAPFSPFKHIKLDLTKVPDAKTINTLMSLLKQRYPSLYNVLIVERNVVMAAHLDRIVRTHPGKNILLVIGAGHEEDLTTRLSRLAHLATIQTQ